jgi:hypothetical protein
MLLYCYLRVALYDSLPETISMAEPPLQLVLGNRRGADGS